MSSFVIPVRPKDLPVLVFFECVKLTESFKTSSILPFAWVSGSYAQPLDSLFLFLEFVNKYGNLWSTHDRPRQAAYTYHYLGFAQSPYRLHVYYGIRVKCRDESSSNYAGQTAQRRGTVRCTRTDYIR